MSKSGESSLKDGKKSKAGKKKSLKDKPDVAVKEGSQVSNAEIFIEIIELALILYMRLENPKEAKSLPVITRVPQLLASITNEKRLAIASIAKSRGQIFEEFGLRMKEMCFTQFDKYNFKRQEKELAWLLLTAHSTQECKNLLNTSESQYRYAVRKMCEKTNTSSRDDLVATLRDSMNEF